MSSQNSLTDIFLKMKQTYYVNKGHTDSSIESIITLLTSALAEKDETNRLLSEEIQRLRKDQEEKSTTT